MSVRSRMSRFLVGLAVATVIVMVGFLLLPLYVHSWGSTREERQRSWPGDGIQSKPAVSWTNGITIDAPAETVWPWIAQLGQGRGGLYSYGFVADLIGRDRNRADKNEAESPNADRILPQYQDPRPGDFLIPGAFGVPPLVVHEVKAWQYLLSKSEQGNIWTMLWYVYPLDDLHSRLVVRMGIQPEEGGLYGSLQAALYDAGGFVMERKMLEGLKARAEGRVEASWWQTLEVAVWSIAYAVAIGALVLFVVRRRWQWPLAIGAASTVVLLAFTFLQPAMPVRLLVDATLVAGLVEAFRRSRSAGSGRHTGRNRIRKLRGSAVKPGTG